MARSCSSSRASSWASELRTGSRSGEIGLQTDGDWQSRAFRVGSGAGKERGERGLQVGGGLVRK